MKTVLVVDDRIDVREAIAEDLTEGGFRVVTAEDGLQGWRRFSEISPSLVVTDVRMPVSDGIDLLRRVRAVSSVPVVLLTAYGDIPTAVQAMRSGATDFLTFPEDMDRVVHLATSLVTPSGRETQNDVLDELLPGRGRAIRTVQKRVTALAPLSVPVLVQGAAGTGRDTVVESLRRLSGGATDFVRIRPSDPAANDAWTAKLDANVYLDRVEDHPAEAQSRWSKRLEAVEREGEAGGFRLFASTSVDLRRRAQEGSFDRNLADQLTRFTISLPTLRDRVEDLPELLACLTEKIKVGRSGIRIRPAAASLLRSYPWPGNLRELESVLERLIAFSDDGVIGKEVVREILNDSRESLAAFRRHRETVEREELVRLLGICGGNVAEVARQLDMSRSAVHYRLRKHGLVGGSSRGRGR